MKIVRIIARLNVGGPARHVVWLTQKLRPDFDSVLIAGTVPDGEEDMNYFATERGIEPVYIPELSRELSHKDLTSLFKIYRQIRRQKPDIIHTHTAKAGTIGRIAAFMYRWLTFGSLIGKPREIKIVHTFHGHVFHSYYGRLKTSVFLMIERILAKIATNKIIVITEQQFREIHGHYGVGSEDQFEIIPLGIDLESYAENGAMRHLLREEISAQDEDIVVGFIGRLTEIKNVPMLLNVASQYKKLSAREKPTFKFAIIGDGNLRSELEKQATDLDLNDIVYFLGNRENIPDMIAGTDIVALTSNNEGTPLSLIEAMASSKPVISTEVGGVVDLLGTLRKKLDGFSVCERGISVTRDSPAEFLNGLIYLAKNEKLQARTGAAGKHFVTEKYSVDRLKHDIETLYRSLVK